MSILAVALMMFSTTVGSITQQGTVNHENLIAADGARSFLETLRNEDFREVFQRYNDDPSDDPPAPAVSPGSRFAIEGLDPGDAPDGLAGQILFPTLNIAGNPLGPPDLTLREDLTDPAFGTPRDLNGDSIIDGADHTLDYLVLPVVVRVRWESKSGPRELELTAMLCELNWP